MGPLSRYDVFPGCGSRRRSPNKDGSSSPWWATSGAPHFWSRLGDWLLASYETSSWTESRSFESCFFSSRAVQSRDQLWPCEGSSDITSLCHWNSWWNYYLVVFSALKGNMTYFFCREDLQLFLEFKFLHTRHAVRRSPCFSRTRRNYSQKGYRSFLCVVLRSFVSFIFPSDQVSCPACIQSIFPLPPTPFPVL